MKSQGVGRGLRGNFYLRKHFSDHLVKYFRMWYNKTAEIHFKQIDADRREKI